MSDMLILMDITRNIHTDPFFNNPVGSIVKHAILNDFTVVCDLASQIAIGAFSSQDCEVIYPHTNEKRISIKENNIYFTDYLYFENDGEKFVDEFLKSKIPVDQIISIIDVYGDVVKKSYANDKGEFNCIWRTDIFYKHDLYRTYKTKIRFVIKDMNVKIAD